MAARESSEEVSGDGRGTVQRRRRSILISVVHEMDDPYFTLTPTLHVLLNRKALPMIRYFENLECLDKSLDLDAPPLKAPLTSQLITS